MFIVHGAWWTIWLEKRDPSFITMYEYSILYTLCLHIYIQISRGGLCYVYFRLTTVIIKALSLNFKLKLNRGLQSKTKSNSILTIRMFLKKCWHSAPPIAHQKIHFAPSENVCCRMNILFTSIFWTKMQKNQFVNQSFFRTIIRHEIFEPETSLVIFLLIKFS